MKEILKKLGFNHMTATLWTHPDIGIISIKDEDDVNDLVKIIYNRGYSECQLIIRTDLGIKPNN